MFRTSQKITAPIRKRRGSAITEFGPAFFLLLVIIFFPMIDMLEMGAAYLMASIFHDSLIRELAMSAPPAGALPPPPGQSAQAPDPKIQTQATAISKVMTEFQGSTFFKFLNLTNNDLKVISIQYIYNPSTSQAVVQCQTQVRVRPFINIPYFTAVPGLNAPVDFFMTTQRPQEELGLS